MKISSKTTSTIICSVAYIIALGAGLAIFNSLIGSYGFHIITATLVADIVATIIIFMFSLIFNNSSIYDPYWSVVPPFLALLWFVQPGVYLVPDFRSIIVLALVFVWGIRLTYNWLSGWKGMQHEDWRYVGFRNKSGKFYWFVSFFGIHLFPTLIVFAACLSLYPVLVTAGYPFNYWDIFALIITLAAIAIETVADLQLRRFSGTKPSDEAIMDKGLWAHSRHPNYFGEILFWWGLFLYSMAAHKIFWWTFIGPVLLTVMFLVISIPMIEKRMDSKRPGYKLHKTKVPKLVPWKLLF